MNVSPSPNLSEKLLDGTWADLNQFENDIIVAMEGDGKDDNQNGKQFYASQPDDGSDDSVLGGESESIIDKQARKVFLELEKIKRVIRGAGGVPQNAHVRKVCDDRSDEFQHDANQNIQKSGSDLILETGQQVCGGDDKHLSLKEENVRLKEVIRQRELELAQARADIKALTARAVEVENMSETHQTKANGCVLDSSFAFGHRKNSKPHLLSLPRLRVRKSSGLSLPTALRDCPSMPMPSTQDGQLVQDHMRAFLRLRPMSKLEMSRRSRNCFDIHDDDAKFTVDSLSGENDFSYDKVFGPDANQMEIYDSFGSDVVTDLMSGINCCVLAYGLASSGRTYTITGGLPECRTRHGFEREDSGSKTKGLFSKTAILENTHAGITPRLIGDLFKSIRASPSSCEYIIKCSYVAVYLEKVFDLLQSHEKKSISVYENSRGIQIDGVSEACCFEEGDILGLIQRGQACLCVLSSRMNVEVNRSHSILTISVTKFDRAKRLTTTAQLQLADLAAFEVPVKVKGMSSQEVKITQKCFSALGNVVKGLVEKGGRVPYTDSKLTSILKDALGGNCRSYLIVTASPSSYSIQETLSTIRIGQRMRRIQTNPQINTSVDVDVYKEWIDTLGDKLRGFVVFTRRVIDAFTCIQDTNNRPCTLSTVLWEDLAHLLDKDRNFFDCSTESCGAFAVLALENWLKNRKYFIEDLCPPQTLQACELKSNTKAESLLSDIQSEAVVLRRQNDLLVQEKRKKDEDLSKLKKEVKLLSLRIAELEHHLNLAEFKEKQAKLFLRQFRKICWNLQKDFLTERRIEIADITANMEGAPDLTGLVGLDTLLLEAGLIATKDIDADDEELGGGQDFLDWAQAKGVDGRVHSQVDENEALTWTTDDEVNGLLGQLSCKKSLQTDLAQERTAAGASRRTKNLQHDLRQVTNKCIELQVLLNEERERIGTILGRNKSLSVKNLTQEVISLRKELDVMKHNAKAATWKLQELHIVNKVLSKKGKETSEHVATLEEGFQRLQETFRTTVLDSLDADAQLNDQIRSLEVVVESLTVPQSDDAEFDVLGRPATKMNLFPCGHQTVISKVDETMRIITQSGHTSGTLKNPKNMLCLRVKRKAKFRRKRKMERTGLMKRSTRGHPIFMDENNKLQCQES